MHLKFSDFFIFILFLFFYFLFLFLFFPMSVAVKLATRYVEMAGGALLPFTGKTFIATLLLVIF
jgi:hypothetical protein